MSGLMCWTILGAQGRYNLASIVGFLGSWGVTLPLGAILTFALDWNLQGLTMAVVLGYIVSGTVNAFLVLTSNWEKISQRVMKQTKKALKKDSSKKKKKYGGDEVEKEDPFKKYSNSYWEELPPECKCALFDD